MNTLDLGNLKIVNLFFKPAGLLIGGKLRKRLMDPMATLKAANVQPGQIILEVGCGTGFFTIPVAELVGEKGCVVALDASSGFLKEVSRKVNIANLKNVRIVQKDALNTELDTESIDKALLVGVLPFPLLPLGKLLPEGVKTRRQYGCMAVSSIGT